MVARRGWNQVWNLYRISRLQIRVIPSVSLNPQGCWQTGHEETGVQYRKLSGSWGADKSASCLVALPAGLLEDCGLDRKQPSYRAFSESTVGPSLSNLPLGIPQGLSQLWATSRSIAGTEFWMFITQHGVAKWAWLLLVSLAYDVSNRAREKSTTAEFSAVQNLLPCLQPGTHSLDQSSGCKPPSQKVIVCLGLYPDFTISCLNLRAPTRHIYLWINAKSLLLGAGGGTWWISYLVILFKISGRITASLLVSLLEYLDYS